MLVALLCLMAPAGSLLASGESPDERSADVSWTPARPGQGDAMAVRVTAGAPISSIEGHFIDRDLVFFPWADYGWKSFAPIPVGARVGERPLRLTIVWEDGERTSKRIMVPVEEHEFGETKLSVDPRFIQPPEEARPRIRRDRERIREAFSDSSEERLWRLPFVRPAEGRPTSRFGVRRTFNGEIRSRHMGLDLDGSPGDPILAMMDGRVVLAHDLFYAGRSVFIDHGHQMFTVYFHMTDIEVEEGEVVRAGQRIGTIGATGRVTGPHLHLGVRIQGRYVNPESFLDLDLGEEPAPPMGGEAAKGEDPR